MSSPDEALLTDIKTYDRLYANDLYITYRWAFIKGKNRDEKTLRASKAARNSAVVFAAAIRNKAPLQDAPSRPPQKI